MLLRPYQQEAVDAALQALANDESPVLALPTGSGKSLVLAEIARLTSGRVLVATHRQELLQQNLAALGHLSNGESAGIYSAGLGLREAQARVVFGGVQSIYRQMDALQAWGAFTLVIVDEVHLVPPCAQASMYRRVFEACPQAPRVGLSATPFRLDDGKVWGRPDTWFTTLAYEIGIQALTPEYLAPLRGILTAHDIDVSGVRTRQGDYMVSDLSQAACADDVIEGALTELCTLAAKRQRWLLFCVDVAHTEMVAERLRAKGVPCAALLGTTPKDERAALLHQFQAGEFRALVGCEVFGVGFDLPAVDVVAMLRPTQSRGLCIQQIGRGSRQAPGKADCVVIDFAGNIERHAPLDSALAELERSPARQARDAKEAEKREAARQRLLSHAAKASLQDPFDAAPAEALTRPVLHVSYDLEPSKKYPGKTNLAVTYRLGGQPKWLKVWVCLEYPGGAAWHARQWFARRGVPMPTTAQDAYTQALQRRYPQPNAVVLVPDGKWMRVRLEHFSAPSRLDADDEEVYALIRD